MASPSIDPAEFREAMGLLPTGVTVVSAFGDSGLSGATANAVCSLSLEPMLMLACLDRGSRTLRSVQSAGRFGINVLGGGHEPLARQFSTKVPEAEKWEGVEWADRTGIPALREALAFLGCELHDVLIGGDHVIVTGEVIAIELGDDEAPLVFHRGAYRPLGA